MSSFHEVYMLVEMKDRDKKKQKTNKQKQMRKAKYEEEGVPERGVSIL